jgi:glycopeptide antibiotics resistance protein
MAKLAFWFAPVLIAQYREHPNKLAIIALNVGLFVPVYFFLLTLPGNFVAQFLAASSVIFLAFPCWLVGIVWACWQIKKP